MKQPVNTKNVEEALLDLEHRRAGIEHAIATLRHMLALMRENAQEAANVEVVIDPPRSCLQDALEVLEHAGRPLHISEIAELLSAKRGRKMTRASVQSTLIHHINSLGNEAKIRKVRPCYYGLRG